MSMTLTLDCPLPPSVNHAYVNVRGRGRVLSAEARAYKEVATWLAFQARQAQGWQYEKGARLSLTLEFHFARGGRRDLSNLVKLVEDALATALGFDDSVIDRLELVRASSGAAPEFCRVRVMPWAGSPPALSAVKVPVVRKTKRVAEADR